MIMSLLIALTAGATSSPVPTTPVDLTPSVQEASRKTGLPEAIIRSVMAVESGGDPRVISSKGAMGVMQLMPATWRYLRAKLDLGPDAFEPHDNILAGASYLRALYDAYGCNGFLAAYNAGPGRYEAYRDTGKALPMETQTYVARITAKLNTSTCTAGSSQMPAPAILWTQADLFAAPPDLTITNTRPFEPSTTPFVTLPASTETTPLN